ncbi:MAG: SIR2 family NAD-dependent protein deacylase [Rubrobacter sp.]
MQDIPQNLLDVLGSAGRVAALTGSGVSAESGIPTFREAQTGLWERFDPKDLATPEAFARDPRLVWEWYEWRRRLVEQGEPNPGHRALVEMERWLPGFILVTQNVDGLHQRAGSRRVTELHGNILRSRCSREGITVEAYDTAAGPPPCPRCGAPLRPDVVWFGEALPLDPMHAASAAARGCDVFLSIGTSSLVYPAAALPYEALDNGAILVEVNPGETPLTAHADHLLRGPAGEVLPRLVAALA